MPASARPAGGLPAPVPGLQRLLHCGADVVCAGQAVLAGPGAAPAGHHLAPPSRRGGRSLEAAAADQDRKDQHARAARSSRARRRASAPPSTWARSRPSTLTSRRGRLTTRPGGGRGWCHARCVTANWTTRSRPPGASRAWTSGPASACRCCPRWPRPPRPGGPRPRHGWQLPAPLAPSKTDTERLLVISPELADVLSAIITRIRDADGSVPPVAAYDYGEKTWNPPLPLLFQWRCGLENRPFSAGAIRKFVNITLAATGLTGTAGQPLRFTPHDFRRLFLTDAVMHGMPPHIAQLVAGHRDINVTMGYKAVYPEEVINGHRAFIARRRALRPSEEYRTPSDAEWEEFLGHFER